MINYFLIQIVSLPIVERMYVGRIPDIGADALTGLGVSTPILLIVSAFSMFISGGAAPLAAISLGKGDKEHSDRILGTSVVLLTIMSFIITILVFVIKEPLLYLFGASDVIYDKEGISKGRFENC